MMTIPRAFGRAVMIVCAARGRESVLARTMLTSTYSSELSVTACARSNEPQALAAARSSARPAEPMRGSSRSIHSLVTPGASVTTAVNGLPSRASSSRSRTEATGVRRHSSSRPVTSGKSACAPEAKRPERD